MFSGTKKTQETLRNTFNEAFLWAVGGGYTNYDTDGKTYVNQGYNVNPFVYGMINQQATKTASVPYFIRKIDDKSSYKKLNRLELATKSNYTIQQRLQKILLENKAYSKEELDFPMDNPNKSQTWTEFMALYKTFLKLTGNVYIYMLSPEDGQDKGTPIQVYLLPSQFMQIIVKNNADLMGVDDPVEGYILIEGRSYIEFKREDVIHIKYPNPNYDENGEHLYGQSPLRSALKTIQSSNVSLDLNIKTLKSGGAFGFIHGKNQTFTAEQASEIKERLLEMNSSPEDLSKIAGVSAEIGFTRLSLTSDELKPFDYLKFDEQQIASVFNWSIEDENRGDFGGTISEIKKTRITDNILPDLKLLANALNEEFLPRFEGYEGTIIEFDVSELPEMQTNTGELVQWLSVSLDKGVVTRNEFRIAINYMESDDPNMDKYTVASDIMTLEEALDDTFKLDEPKVDESDK